MNWLNSNMHSDDSSTDSSASDTDTTTNTNNANKTYLCLVCDKRTKRQIFNKVQSCLQCPNCTRSWCLEDVNSLNKKKCPNLDLIQKRYLEIKFSKSKHNKNNHHTTKHMLHWIGTNILGNLGNINDTFNQINLARNFDEPTLETLRAQQRFGIQHPNLMKYHPTHPVIIGSLPKLNVKDNKTHQLLIKENVCPICQLEFIDNGIESSDDELDQLLSSDNDQDISINLNKNDNESKEEDTDKNIFNIMNKSKKLKVINSEISKPKLKTEPIGNVVHLYGKQSETKTNKKGINIGNELIASHTNDINLHETMNVSVNDSENIQSNDNIITEWTPNNESKIEENNVENNENDLDENNENENEKTFKFEINKCDNDKIDHDNIVR
eukprot:318611_1